MPAVSVETFLVHLRKSNLLLDAQCDEVEKLQQAEGSVRAEDTARRLVKRGWLTTWQARMLLAGRHAFFLGRYKLLDQLGRGGMGTVFKAQHATMGRIVALKVMDQKLLKNPGAVTRFQREIQAAAALDHPGIVMAYDADSFQDTHFLVMEFVDGEDLDALLKKKGKLPIDEACEYIRQAARGLAHAHEKGMVHRDIKPSNLLLARNPQGGLPTVKILDMGLARFTSEAPETGQLTQTGQIMGTPDYIAPEQARNTRHADIRSDIYSLGCTLFRLLTNRVPFDGDNVMEKLMARATTDAPAISTFNAEIPRELEAVVAKMLARDVGQRYQVPGDVAEALAPFTMLAAGSSGVLRSGDTNSTPGSSLQLTPSPEIPSSAAIQAGAVPPGQSDRNLPVAIDVGLEQFLQNLGTAAVAETPAISTETVAGKSGMTPQAVHPAEHIAGPQVRKTRRAAIKRAGQLPSRHRAVAVTAAVVAVVVCAAGAVVWQKVGQTVVIVDWPAGERQAATLEVDGHEVPLSGDKSLEFAAAPGKRGVKLKRKGYFPIEENWTLSRGETRTVRPEWKPTPDSIRNQEWMSLKKEGGTVLARFTGGFPRIDDPAAVALKTKLAAFRTRAQGTAEGQEAATLFSRLPGPADMLRPGQIPPRELRSAGDGDPALAPAELAAVVGDGRLRNWVSVLAVALSPDGRLLASGGRESVIRIWDAATGEERFLLRGPGTVVRSLAFSPDGKTLAVGSEDFSVRLWDADKSQTKERTTLGKHAGYVMAVAFSPDGKQLVSGSSGNGAVHVWNVDGGGSAPPKVFTGHKAAISAVAFALDNVRFASGSEDGTICLWEGGAKTSPPLRTLKGHRNSVLTMSFAPDGKSLASGGVDRMVLVWKLEGTPPAEPRVVSLHRNQVAAVAFSPDGKKILSASDREAIHVANLSGGDEQQATNKPSSRAIIGAAFSRDGKRLATCNEDGLIKLRDVATGAELIETGPFFTAVAASPDGRRLAIAAHDGSVRLWDFATTTETASLTGHLQQVLALAFSPNGTRLVSAGTDMTVRLWDVAKASEIQTHYGHTGVVRCVAFSPDGASIVSGGADQTVRLWEAGSDLPMLRTTLQQAGNGSIGGVAFSPDGKTIAAASSDRVVRIFDVKSGRERRTLLGHEKGVRCVAFSPDGKWLASGGDDLKIKLWDAALGQVKQTLEHREQVYSLAFNPEGTTLAAAIRNGGVKLWEVPAGIETKVWRFVRFGGTVAQTGCTYLPDGRHLVTLNGNGTVYVLRLADWSPNGGVAKAEAAAAGAETTEPSYDPAVKKKKPGVKKRKEAATN